MELINTWGSIDNARKELVAPILAYCFKLGYSDNQIHDAMPFFQNVKDFKSKLEHWTRKWFAVKGSIQAKFFLETMSLNDFLSKYQN